MTTLLTVTEAAAAVKISEKTLYRHEKLGKVSSTKDGAGKTRFEVCELVRAYGELKVNPDITDNTTGNKSVLSEAERALINEEHLRNHIKQLEQTIESLKEDKRMMQQIIKDQQQNHSQLLLERRSNVRQGIWGWFKKPVTEGV